LPIHPRVTFETIHPGRTCPVHPVAACAIADVRNILQAVSDGSCHSADKLHRKSFDANREFVFRKIIRHSSEIYFEYLKENRINLQIAH